MELTIFNSLGQKVRTIVNSSLSAGFHTAKWDGKNDSGIKVASGLYIYQISAGKFVQSKRMILIK